MDEKQIKQVLDRAYTNRWYITEAINAGIAGNPKRAVELLTEARTLDEEVLALFEAWAKQVEGVVQEPPPPVLPPIPGTDRKWLPYARRDVRMKAQGRFEAGGPKGCIVHHSASHYKTIQDVINMMAWGRDQGLGFHALAQDGTFFQGFELDQIGAHAGTSYWPGIGASVSRELMGIEVIAAGILDADKTAWFDKVRIPDEDIRCVKQEANMQAGCYHEFTPKQEAALINILCDIKDLYPETFRFEFVLGHDEVAGPRGLGLVNSKYKNSWRKNDPGGSLSTNMDLFRAKLRAAYAARKG